MKSPWRKGAPSIGRIGSSNSESQHLLTHVKIAATYDVGRSLMTV